MDAARLAQAVGMPVARASQWVKPLDAAFSYAKIDTRERVAAFLAQIGHESAGFRYTREIWGPTAAQLRYEGRRDLGNTHPGDGSRYRGRGLIQITGRANYRAATENLRCMDAPDFEQEPEALERPIWAALSAADYWLHKDLNRYADSGDFKALTRRINGGYNGLADRMARWERATKALQGA